MYAGGLERSMMLYPLEDEGDSFIYRESIIILNIECLKRFLLFLAS